MIKPLLRRFSHPPTLRRILLEAFGLFALHWGLLHGLARAQVLEQVAAPDSSLGVVALSSLFYGLRIAVFWVLPGWFVVRLWLYATRDRDPRYE